MTITDNKQVVLRFNKEFIEGGNTAILDEIVAPDFTNHTAVPGVPKDVSGLIQFIGMLRTGFPDLRVDILDQVGEGDLVASRKVLRGTHLGNIMGHAPTGKEVIMNVMDFVRLRDGQYVDHWGRNDVMQVIGQL
ncbi:ester cyclase [Taibaiella koreensis]|uniref:ester cyclase n=1 Tax=Taibaiella koreensis TaxID=1268548 RepID=UPI00196969BE|nr:ester cyclase [Taibaiella koreensis]